MNTSESTRLADEVIPGFKDNGWFYGGFPLLQPMWTQFWKHKTVKVEK